MLLVPEFVPRTMEDLPKAVDELMELSKREAAVEVKKAAILEYMKNNNVIGRSQPQAPDDPDPEEDEEEPAEEDSEGVEEFEP